MVDGEEWRVCENWIRVSFEEEALRLLCYTADRRSDDGVSGKDSQKLSMGVSLLAGRCTMRPGVLLIRNPMRGEMVSRRKRGEEASFLVCKATRLLVLV